MEIFLNHEDALSRNCKMQTNNKGSFQKRQIAYKVRVKDILNGEYIREEGWQPNYVLFPNGQKISRVNIIGTIVATSNENNYQSFLLDDGSGKVSVRFFQGSDVVHNTSIGDIVLLIGRIREYGNERYIVPETIKKVTNKMWIQVRKLELKQQRLFPQKKAEVTTPEIKKVVIESDLEKGPTQKIYDLIKRLDNGDGVDIDNILQQINEKNVEDIINNLLERGEIFEIRRGRLKVLE